MVYILPGRTSGSPPLLTPSFTYKSFRYVEVRASAWPELGPEALTAYFAHTAVRPTAAVWAAEPLLNYILAAAGQSVLSNLYSIPTDCPSREKRGWLGDAQWSSENNAVMFDMRQVYSNWVQTIGETQATGCSHANRSHPPPARCLAANISDPGYAVVPAWAARPGAGRLQDRAGVPVRPPCYLCCDGVIGNAQRFGCYVGNQSRGTLYRVSSCPTA